MRRRIIVIFGQTFEMLYQYRTIWPSLNVAIAYHIDATAYPARACSARTLRPAASCGRPSPPAPAPHPRPPRTPHPAPRQSTLPSCMTVHICI